MCNPAQRGGWGRTPVCELTSLARRVCSNLSMGSAANRAAGCSHNTGWTHFERSSCERLSGLLVSVMPSFLRRLSMTGAKVRAPPFPAGHSPAEERSVALHGRPTRHPLPREKAPS